VDDIDKQQSEWPDRPARPWDVLNLNIDRVSGDISNLRYEICKSCEFITSVTRQCKKCLCFMKIKTTLPNAECPLGKWKAEKKSEIW
jgi:hypothetical protein